MGLGIQITAPLPSDFSPKKLIDGVMRTLHAGMDPILQPALSVVPQENARQAMVYAHPAEEPLYITWNDDHISLSARTNSAGPGYHAWLVERMDAMEPALGFKWEWRDDDGNFGDETDYAEHRDFTKLQHSMLAWLKALSHTVTQHEQTCWALCMPVGTRVSGEYFACSPLGFWDSAFFEKIATAPNLDGLDPAAARFFPWWTRELDADFWAKHGLVYAWCHVPWRVADDEDETQAMKLALACFKKAREFDSKMALPEAEIAELERLIATTTSTNKDPIPDPKLIGFKRRDNILDLPGHWQIRLPGYFHSNWDSEKGTMTFYFGQRTLHISTYRFKHPTNDLKELLGPLEPPAKGSRAFEFAKDHLLGRAVLTHQKDGSIFGYWMLTGKMVTAGSSAVFTLCFDNRDDLEWANDTWQSLFKPAPKPTASVEGT